MTDNHESAPDATASQARRAHSPRSIAGEFARFLVMGGANTLVAYAVYLVLLNWMHYQLAYTIGYAVGIAMAYALSAGFVFRQPMHRRSAFRFPLIYVAQFLVSFALLRIGVEWLRIPEWLALGVAVIATIPVTFVLSRWVIRAG